MNDDIKNKFSEKFWNKVETLEFLSADYISNILLENQNSLVPFPENMLLKQLVEFDKKAGDEKKRHLLPERYPENSFFIADDFDIPVFRDDIASMEHPLFALKSKDTRVIQYEHNDIRTKIYPASGIGRATIFDKDIWIYCISKLMQAKYEEKEIEKTIRFSIHDFLVQTNRPIGGSAYEQFKASLARLKGTTIQTEIKTGESEQVNIFGLLESAQIIKNNNNQICSVEVELPEWLFRSIVHNEVLNIDVNYFRLRKPIDRRIYELARKHCSNKLEWSISLDKLHKKTGTTDVLRNFRAAVNSLCKTDSLPGYKLVLNKDKDIVTFINKNPSVKSITKDLSKSFLD